MTLGYVTGLMVLSLFLSACSHTSKMTDIADLESLPQTAEPYTQALAPYEFSEQGQLNHKFDEIFFSPWELTQMSVDLEQASWGNFYLQKETYGENHKLRKKEWYEEVPPNDQNKWIFGDFITLIVLSAIYIGKYYFTS